MKKIAIVISAATLAVASTSVFAWGWGPAAGGYNGYYAPYGYGIPAAPAALSEEQQQAIAEQQKLIAEQHTRMIENMQKAQQQAAEYYASQPVPGFAAQPVFGEDPFLRQMDAMWEQMDAMREARLKEMDARMEASRQAPDFYGSQPFPGFAGQPGFADSFGDDAYLRQMEEERAARIKAIEARRDEARKAAEARRQAAEERYKARRLERRAPVDAPAGV